MNKENKAKWEKSWKNSSESLELIERNERYEIRRMMIIFDPKGPYIC